MIYNLIIHYYFRGSKVFLFLINWSFMNNLSRDSLFNVLRMISFNCSSSPEGFRLVPVVFSSNIRTELLYIDSSWSPNTCSSMWRGPQEYIAYEFVLTSPAVTNVSSLSNLDGFQDGWLVTIQLQFCWVLPPAFVQYGSLYSCVIAVKLFFLRTLTGASISIFTNPSARAGYDTWSIFKWSLTGLNSEFSFS